jgi:hypothetical protein
LLNLNRKGGIHELEQKIWVLTEENQKLKHLKPNFTIEEVERLKQENKKLRLELQQAGVESNVEDFSSQRNEFTPSSVFLKTGSLPQSPDTIKKLSRLGLLLQKSRVLSTIKNMYQVQ